MDIRFLRAVDILLDANKKEGKDPGNASTLSMMLANNRNTISKIRSGLRQVTFNQLVKFASMFNIDYNYFFRDDVNSIFYKAKSGSSGEVIKVSKKGVLNTAPGAMTIQIGKGDMKGNIYNGPINQNVRRIVHLIPKQFQEECKDIVGDIYGEVTQLEASLHQKTEDIKKISEDSKQTIMKLQEELKEAQRSKSELMEKYIAELEKNK